MSAFGSSFRLRASRRRSLGPHRLRGFSHGVLRIVLGVVLFVAAIARDCSDHALLRFSTGQRASGEGPIPFRLRNGSRRVAPSPFLAGFARLLANGSLVTWELRELFWSVDQAWYGGVRFDANQMRTVVLVVPKSRFS